jgi:hypothetical protein
MAIKIGTISDTRKEGIKLLGYGQSGVGKTRLIQTMESPILLNVEDKLGCLEGLDIPVISVYNAKEAIEAINWMVGSDEIRQYSDIAVDSISELCDFIHADVYEKHNGNTFKVGPEVYTTITSIIKSFKGLKSKNIYFIAKCHEATDENGIASYVPMMSNTKVQLALPYKFDIVFAVRSMKFDGKDHDVLQCKRKGKWFANDIYNVLDEYEQPNLSKLINKIKGEK